MTIDATVDAILVGLPEPFGPRGGRSTIAARRPVAAKVRVTESGLEGDAVGEPKVHGGPDMALHHYPGDHYPAWARELEPPPPILGAAGAFGENLSTHGVTEADICVGDVLRLGSAIIQLSQGRQPCYKLNRRFARPDMARRVQATGRTGWYYRVLEAGEVAPGERLRLVERPHPEWPVLRLARALYVDMLDRETLEGIAGLGALSSGWRLLARRRLDTGTVEDWRQRLGERRPTAT